MTTFKKRDRINIKKAQLTIRDCAFLMFFQWLLQKAAKLPNIIFGELPNIFLWFSLIQLLTA